MEPNPKTKEEMAELRRKASEESYETKVWRMFDAFPMDAWFDMRKNVKQVTWERFIQAVKLHCDLHMGDLRGYYLQPNNEWTMIKKTSIPIIKNPTGNENNEKKG